MGTSLEVGVLPEEWASLERRFTLRREREVRGFLEGNPFLVPLLLGASEAVQSVFPLALPVLELIRDPEGAAEDHLTLHIPTSLPAEEALAGLRRIDEDWWLENLGPSRGKLNLHLEFV